MRQGRWLCIGLGALIATGAYAQALFTPSERESIVRFWNEPNRYQTSPDFDPKKPGLWQVRLTPEGSLWLWNYNQVRGLGKVAPGTTAKPQNDDQAVWETWISSKIAYDRWTASQTAAASNALYLHFQVPAVPEPTDPGEMPAGLRALAGPAPEFAACVIPTYYKVQFDDTCYAYSDQVPIDPKYAYFRFSQGVRSGGTKVGSLPPDSLNKLFNEAQIDPVAAKVMQSVSLLEGGFDAINTYDTGFLSVGFIQFAACKAGGGSLGQVLSLMKRVYPKGFDETFHQYGVDVTPEGLVAVVDPLTGMELAGPTAVAKTIEDKRLTAVFQRAGQRSDAFRIAQLRLAKEQYYPGSDCIQIVCDGQTCTWKVCDFIHSEAGLATLMDRKVNTGRLDPLNRIVAKVVNDYGLKSVTDLALYERAIVDAIRFRKNFLLDSGLSQPPLLPNARDTTVLPSRKGKGRSGRG